MAMELVTGYQGAAHVTADQDADLQRGIFGSDGILQVGEELAVDIISANEITVADGVVVADGREFYIPVGETVSLSIASGAQSVQRYDLVVVQYSKDSSTGIESGDLVVITGTASTSPEDPSYTEADIRDGVFIAQKPPCRVCIVGLAIDSVVMLMDTLPSLAETVVSSDIRKIVKVSALPSDPEDDVLYVVTE